MGRQAGLAEKPVEQTHRRWHARARGGAGQGQVSVKTLSGIAAELVGVAWTGVAAGRDGGGGVAGRSIVGAPAVLALDDGIGVIVSSGRADGFAVSQ
jgi:hypothetical protein